MVKNLLTQRSAAFLYVSFFLFLSFAGKAINESYISDSFDGG